MFIILLRFADRSRAAALGAAHNEWIRRGFDDGVFALVGSLQPGLGGCILAHGASRAEIVRRVNADPFVAGNVVNAEVLEVAPSKVETHLASWMP